MVTLRLIDEPLIQSIITGLLAFAVVQHYAPWWIALDGALITYRFLLALLERP